MMLRRIRSAIRPGWAFKSARMITTGPKVHDGHFPVEQFADIKVKQEGKPINLYSYKFPAKGGDPKAIVLLHHGYAEYTGASLILYAKLLAEKGICSIGIDQRGFGRSEGIRGYLNSFEDIVSDCKEFVKTAQERDAQLRNKPIFIMGVSMGGASAIYTALKAPELAKGVILFSPALEQNKKLVFGMSLLLALAPLLKHCGKMGVATFPFDRVSKNKEFLDRISNDPLMFKSKLRISSGLAIVEAQKYIMENAKNMTTPYMLYHGSGDRVVETEPVKRFHNMTQKVKEKKLSIIPDGEHDVAFNDDKIEGISQEISDWISKLI